MLEDKDLRDLAKEDSSESSESDKSQSQKKVAGEANFDDDFIDLKFGVVMSDEEEDNDYQDEDSDNSIDTDSDIGSQMGSVESDKEHPSPR